MDEKFEGVLKQVFHKEDIKSLTNEIREQESTMKLKRRWLMDLPLSDKEENRMEELLLLNDKIMPESFLREDDVSYEAIKTCIRKAFGAHNSGDEPICVQDDKKILTEGLNKFDKTKPKRSSLPLKEPTDFCGNQMADCASESYCAAALTVLDELTDFPSNALRAMRRKLQGAKGYIPTLQPSKFGFNKPALIVNIRTECMKILSSIKRKKRMSTECFTEEEHAEQLAGVLGVAGLTLKHVMNRPAVRDFRRFSPEMEALHNDIGKAIHNLNERSAVSVIELRKVVLLLDPNSKMTDRSLRKNVRNLLIDYLYECSDMDNVPEIFIESLGIINGRAQRLPSRKRKSSTSKVLASSKEVPREEIEKEIEQVLNISAQAKAVVANLLPEHVFDEDFARAYMEDFEECDTLCRFDLQMEDCSHHFEFRSYSSYDRTECTGETNLLEFNSPVSTSIRGGCLPLSPESVHLNKINSQSGSAYSDSLKMIAKPSMTYVSHSHARKSSHSDLKREETTSFSTGTTKHEVSDFQVEERDIVQKQSTSANEYLNLQEACDNTSTVAYRFVGHMLDTLAKAQGVVLHQRDRLYLQNYKAVPEVTREFSSTLAQKFSGMWKNVLDHH